MFKCVLSPIIIMTKFHLMAMEIVPTHYSLIKIIDILFKRLRAHNLSDSSVMYINIIHRSFCLLKAQTLFLADSVHNSCTTYHYNYLCVSVSLRLSVSLSVSLCLSPSLFVYVLCVCVSLSLCFFTSVTFFVLICLPLSISAYVCLRLSLCLCLSMYLSVSLRRYVCLCLFVCLTLSPSRSLPPLLKS